MTNTGGSTAINQGVYDAVQEGLTVVANSVSTEHHGTVVNEGAGASQSDGGQTIKSITDAEKVGFTKYEPGVAWVIDSIEPGASVDLTFKATVTDSVPDDIARNQATWGPVPSPDNVPTTPLPNTSNIVEHPLLREPKPVLNKATVTKGTVKRGDKVEFVVTVRNDGNTDMVGYELDDIPRSGLEYLSDDHNGTKTDKGVRWLPLDLAVGEEVKIKVTCRVTATQSGKLYNDAFLYSPDGHKLVADSSSEVIVVADVASDLIKTGAGGIIAVMLATAAANASTIATILAKKGREER
jgi:uncharacterized repeat protein (TIGR01451 family)